MIPDLAKLVAKFDRVVSSLERIVYLLEQQAARETLREREKDCISDDQASHGNERRNDPEYAAEVMT
jgi:hypothetical protein